MGERALSLFESRRSRSIGFTCLVLTTVAIRFVVFRVGDAPPTIDAGNWLAFGDAFLGDGYRSSSLTYPPVVPLLAWASTAVFGLVDGVSLLAALASVAPSVGVFVALGRLGCGRARIAPALILLGAGSVTEAASWGGFPQLIAMGLMPLGLVLILEFFEQPTPASALRSAIANLALFATSHLVAAYFVVAVIILFVDAAVRRKVPVAPILRNLAIVVVPLALLAPVYARLAHAVLIDPNPFADRDNLTLSNLVDRLEGVYGDAPMMWRFLVALAIVSLFVRWESGSEPLARLTRASMLGLLVMLVATREGRYLFMLTIPVTLALTQWTTEIAARIERRDSSRMGWLVAACVALVAGQFVAGTRVVDDHRFFYAVLTPDLVEGFELAGDETESDEILAMPSIAGAPVGWWLESISERTVFYGSALRWLNFDDEVERASVANRVFRPDFPASDSARLLEDADISVVVLPRKWRWFDLDLVQDWVDDHGFDVVGLNADAMVVRVRWP